ncbi:MAG: phosphoenolpyruvate carboxykinase (ATP) [Vampirovibrionales bacterium]|nr:phosphoenolpyruvate carboxykinase (ATP) [Vampirovibrionales bacterium]
MSVSKTLPKPSGARACADKPVLTGLDLPLEQLQYQLSVAELIEHALRNGEGVLASTGALVVNTGQYSGRSPKDRFIVDDSERVHDCVDWGSVNAPIASAVFETVFNKIMAYLQARNVYVFDGFSGADSKHRLNVRFINELASQSLFVHQLFLRPTTDELQRFKPDFTVIAAPGLKLNSSEDGVNSEAAILLDFERRMVLIAGTSYSGEIKKSVFSAMNFLMPSQDVLPMHCAANVSKTGKSALFFGLSGTGKTTLSADPERDLLGDDEHGWSAEGIFNFEGGCYAKTIRLNPKTEPDIFQAIRFGTLLENVTLDPLTREVEFDDDSQTENGRAGYPIDFIAHIVPGGMAAHPDTIIFLTADAFGVLPAIAKLTPEQAQYHFMSGYTSKLAGTERGVKSPQTVFSACFGAPFMPRPATVYAQLLADRIARHGVQVYLINTGWQGGSYNQGGTRFSIPVTRAIVRAAVSGQLAHAALKHLPGLNLNIPLSVPGVDPKWLDPRGLWADPDAYDAQAAVLTEHFIQNFERFKNADHLIPHGPTG